MRKRVFILKALLLTVNAINPLFTEPLYHLAHLFYAFTYGMIRFGQEKLLVFLIFYFLALEFIAEKFIFTKSKRKQINAEGKELIEMIKEEIIKRKN